MADSQTPIATEEVSLSTQLLDAYYLFVESFQNVLDSYSEVPQTKVKEFVTDFARTRTPYAIFSPAGITSLVEHIFTVDIHRDFLWKLIITYFSTLGYDKVFHEKLCETLSFSLDVADKLAFSSDEDSTLTPEELTTRTLGADEIKDYLLANKWLVVLVLIQINYKRVFPEVKTTIQSMVETVS